MAYENLSFSELTKTAESLLEKGVLLKTIKNDFLAAGHSHKTYEAVERVVYLKNLVPLSRTQKLKKRASEYLNKKLGIVKIDPKKKLQVITSVIMFLLLMIYFIAIFRNLDKGPFYAFVNNPFKLAFTFKAPQKHKEIIITKYLEPKIDIDLRGKDKSLNVVERTERTEEVITKEVELEDLFEIEGYELALRKFFDSSSNNWSTFLLEMENSFEQNDISISEGELSINKRKQIEKGSFISGEDFTSMKVLFDRAKSEDIFIFKKTDALKVESEAVFFPVLSLVKKIQKIAKLSFYNSIISFKSLPKNIIHIAFEDEDNTISKLNIEYYFFRDPITQESQIGFKGMAKHSSGIFEAVYPVKRSGPRPSGINKDTATSIFGEEDLDAKNELSKEGIEDISL